LKNTPTWRGAYVMELSYCAWVMPKPKARIKRWAPLRSTDLRGFQSHSNL